MKILQICYVYPPSFSGYGRQLATINSEISFTYGHDVFIITGYDGMFHKNLASNICAAYSKPRNEYLETSQLRKLLRLMGFCLFILRHVFKFFDAEVVHVVKAGPEAALCALICGILDKKLIVKVAQDDINERGVKKGLASRTLRWVKISLLRCASALIVLSKETREQALRLGFRDSQLIFLPNAVNVAKFGINSDGNGYDADKSVSFVFLGKVCKRKGVLDLLNAMKDISLPQQIVLNIYGPLGDDMPDFSSIVSGLSGHVDVRYFGETDSPHLVLSDADFMILPSYSEGMPNAVLESLCAGVPVICSNLPVHEEVVSEQDGLLFPVGDVEGMRQVILEAAISVQLWRSRRQSISIRACERYSVTRISALYDELYRNLGVIK